MNVQYIIKIGDEEQGPYAYEDLLMYEKIGDIAAETPTRIDGQDIWKTWSRVKITHKAEQEQIAKYRAAIDPALPVQQKSVKQRGVFIILGILLGGIGAHNFYANYYVRGFIQLLLTLTLMAVFFPAVGLVGIWIIIELFTTDHDAEGLKLS